MTHSGYRGKTAMRLCIAAVIMAHFASCSREPSVSRIGDAPENEPNQQFSHSRIVITEVGVTSAIVQAESIQVFQATGYTAIEGGMIIDFYNKNGEQTSELTAGRGEVWGLFEKVDSLTARDNVTIVSTDGLKRMETASAFTWNAETRKIRADGLVKLITEDATEQGINFVATDDLSEYSMDNVTGEYEGSGITLPDR